MPSSLEELIIRHHNSFDNHRMRRQLRGYTGTERGTPERRITTGNEESSSDDSIYQSDEYDKPDDEPDLAKQDGYLENEMRLREEHRRFEGSAELLASIFEGIPELGKVRLPDLKLIAFQYFEFKRPILVDERIIMMCEEEGIEIRMRNQGTCSFDSLEERRAFRDLRRHADYEGDVQ